MIEADVLVIGGGTAGSVLASRLSQNPATRVVLLEAGRDIAPDKVPADVAGLFPLATFNPAYAFPGLTVHWQTAATSPAAPFAQGRVMGGGSTVMGMWALRGVPEDYDEWAAAGADGWSYEAVLPFLRGLETDQDFPGEAHGGDGPIEIRRAFPEEWSPFAHAVHAAARARGFPDVADMNADFRDGHCLLPVSRTATGRSSAGLAYLGAAVRARENLSLLAETPALCLLVESGAVTGALARRADGTRVAVRARETVLAAGAIHTPAMMMRAGIGPGAALRALGVKVVADRPGVGANLQNHPFLPILAFLKRRGADPRRERPTAYTYLRWSSARAGGRRGDLGLYIRDYLTWNAFGRRMAMLSPVLMAPASRGRVSLASPDAQDHPLVEFAFLASENDRARLLEAVRLARALFASPPVAAACGRPFLMARAERAGRFNTLSRRNAVAGRLGAALLDVSERAARLALSRFADVIDLEEAAAAPQTLVAAVEDALVGTNHVAGTCRMGRPDDPHAVTDPEGRVIGVPGLSVADASVMPSVPSGNTHVPTVMVAEKLAVAIARRTGRTADR